MDKKDRQIQERGYPLWAGVKRPENIKATVIFFLYCFIVIFFLKSKYDKMVVF